MYIYVYEMIFIHELRILCSINHYNRHLDKM